ncbi:NAD(P)/FAD-dependent oxidoreductase [Streptomyces sp. NPDC048389]|uniref:NAD(P)/FAD-dependent oxidoreductase n=1 Tax=Streptomyces sp. NPDC048389 TaxID=3154622 RepID=UPI0034522B41
MLSTAHDADVVIVGGGIAGLSAAHRLTGAGVTVSVLEAAPAVGGTATTQLDGFRLDRTGRLLCTSYPELRRTAVLRDADLRMFSPGVLVHSAGRLQRTGEVGGARWGPVHGRRSMGRGSPSGAQGTGVAFSVARALASAPRPRQLDQARLGTCLARLAATPVDSVLARPERSAAEALYGRGLPTRTVHGFLRPLLSALLGDPELTSTSSRCADLALRGYARGRLCAPAGGAATLPELLAAGLPTGSVRTGVRVTDVSTTSVTTEEFGRIHCRSVLLATGARAAASLLPGLRVPSYHPVTVVHHTAPQSPLREPSLILDADRSGPVSHTAVMSEVDPSRASDGRVLISSTVLGEPPDDLDRRVRRQLATLYGRPTDDWELLAAHHDPEAVPAMPAPHDLRRPVRVLSGLYVCGDHRDTGTVQGALFSGRRAAHAILNDFGIPAGSVKPLAAAA